MAMSVCFLGWLITTVDCAPRGLCRDVARRALKIPRRDEGLALRPKSIAKVARRGGLGWE